MPHSMTRRAAWLGVSRLPVPRIPGHRKAAVWLRPGCSCIRGIKILKMTETRARVTRLRSIRRSCEQLRGTRRLAERQW